LDLIINNQQKNKKKNFFFFFDHFLSYGNDIQAFPILKGKYGYIYLYPNIIIDN